MGTPAKIFLVLFLVIVVIGAVLGYQWFRASNQTPTDRILVSGNMELEQVDVAFKVAGRLIERTVNEGDPVQKGMVLARLDQDQLMSQRHQLEAALHSTEALMTQAETNVEFQKRSLQSELELRQADVRTAQAHLKELQQGARPQEVQEAVAALEGAQAELDNANTEYERAKRLRATDDIPQSQLQRAQARVQGAQANVTVAKQRLDLVRAGAKPEVIEGAEAQLSKAQSALKGANVNELQITRSEQELDVRAAEIERAKAQIAVIDTQLKETEVRSQIDGVVLVKSAEVGEILAPGAPVMTIGDLQHPWLRAYVGEKELGRVKVGSAVKVTTDSFPGKIYKGQISFISSEAEFTPKQIQTKEGRARLVYRIKISVENPNRELKSNMPADAEILLSD